MSVAVTEDALLGGLVRLRQPAKGHRAGTDAVLLAGLAGVQPGDRVADLGSASGAVGLMVAMRVPTADVMLLEKDPDLVGLARENVALNGLQERVAVTPFDAFQPPVVVDTRHLATTKEGRGVGQHRFDVVVTNPPFFDAQARASPDPGRHRAHVMTGGDVSGWIEAAAGILEPKGRIVLIHRADALDRCLGALAQRFGSISLLAIHPQADKPATRILLRARKGGRAPLQILAPLTLHRPDGQFDGAAAALHARPPGL